MPEEHGEHIGARTFDDRTFRRLAELAPDALIAHSGGRILWANEAAAKMIGMPTAAEMVGRLTSSFVAPESLPIVQARMQRVLATGQSEPLIEETFIRVDGQRLPVEVAASTLGDGVILVAIRDIRPRLQEERERRVAQARARAFFDATTEAMGISRQGVHVEVNAAYARLFGYAEPAELVGRPIFDLLDPSEHQRIRAQAMHRAKGEPVPSTFAVRGRRRDGSPLLLDVQASSYPDGDAFTTVVVMRDITEQHAFEAKLAASEQRYRELVHQVPVGVWETDFAGVKRLLDGLHAQGVREFARHLRDHPDAALACVREMRVVSVNTTACEMSGARDQAELVANLHRVIVPETVSEFGLAISQLMEGRRVATTEGWIGTLSGDRRWVAVRTALVEGHEGDWGRVLVTISDVTEVWRARQEKAALQEQLRHAEKLEAVGRLAGGVAHDFNNLLTAILGYAEVSLDEVPPGSTLHQSLSVIQEASLRARDLVRQILTFGRKDQPRHAPLDLSEVVTGALGLARVAIPSTVSLDVSVAPGVGTVLADRTQVHQIVLNLCANARDAVGPTGRIQVVLERVAASERLPQVKGPEQARLRVRDDGVGMDEATQARLFEPYMTTKAHAGGHGLGLAVVHGIVAAAGGAILVQSAPGKGSCFDVYFPLAEGAPPQLDRPAAGTGGHGRVLLVDDEPLVRAAFCRLLQSLGYQVTEAGDGQEALARLRAAPGDFDLVFSDQTMPNLSGLELARTMLAERPGTRILLCTGFSDALDEAGVLAMGVKGLLTKPVDKAVLAAAVRRALA